MFNQRDINKGIPLFFFIKNILNNISLYKIIFVSLH
jgi:hypothetical protein